MAKPKLPPCSWCRKPADRACDGPVVRADGNDSRYGDTCSAPVCSACATHLPAARPITAIVCTRSGKGRGCEVIDNRGDLCPFCAGRRGDDPLPKAEHKRLLAQSLPPREPVKNPKTIRKSSTVMNDENATFQRGPQRGEKIYFIDANNWVHRLYHAMPPMLSPSGAHVNAVIGVLSMLRKLRTMLDPPPRWIVPVFDAAPDGGWRRERFADYKADRKPQDEDLRAQWGPIREMLGALGLYVASIDGLEADDLISAYTEAAVAAGLRVMILSSDKDLLQLVREDPEPVRVYQVFGKEPELRAASWVREKYGVGPERFGDLLALAGDKSDGIPGCSGVGLKTAAKILTDHPTRDLEQLISDWSLINPHKAGEALRDNAEQVRLSRELVRFADVPLPRPLCELQPWGSVGRRGIDEFFQGLGYLNFEAALKRSER